MRDTEKIKNVKNQTFKKIKKLINSSFDRLKKQNSNSNIKRGITAADLKNMKMITQQC